MKKLLLFLLIFSIPMAVFAQVALEPKIEVEAEAIVGADLDRTTTVGFETSAKATVNLILREEASEEFGEGRVYGWINLKDLKIELKAEAGDGGPDNLGDIKQSFDWGDIEARINFGPVVYLNIRKSDKEVNKASRSNVIAKGMFDEVGDIKFLAALDAATVSPGFDQDLSLVTNPDGVGVALGFNLLDGDLNIEAGLSSDKVFDNSAYNNEMVASLKAEHKAIPDVFTWSLTSVNVLNRGDELAGGNENYYSVGVKVEPAIPVGDFKLSIPVGADVVLGSANDESDLLFNYEVGGGIKYTWASRGTDGSDKNIGFFDADAEVTSGVSLGFSYLSNSFTTSNSNGTENAKLDTPLSAITAQLSLYEDSGDDGIVPLMGGQLVTSMYYYLGGKWDDAASEDLNGRMDLGVGFHNDFDLGIVKPFAGVFFQWADVTDTLKDSDVRRRTLGLKAGIELKELVDNTTFTLAYASGDLLNEDTGSDVTKGNDLYKAQAVSSSKVGQITLGIKISF